MHQPQAWDGNPGKDLLASDDRNFTMAIADKTSQNANYALLAYRIKYKTSSYYNCKGNYIARKGIKTLSQCLVSLFCSDLLDFSLNLLSQTDFTLWERWISSFYEHVHFPVIWGHFSISEQVSWTYGFSSHFTSKDRPHNSLAYINPITAYAPRTQD